MYLLFVWNVPDVRAFVSSLNMKVDLRGPAIVAAPEVISHSQLLLNKQVWDLAVHSGPSEKQVLILDGFLLFLQNMWIGRRSHTYSQITEEEHARGSMKRK